MAGFFGFFDFTKEGPGVDKDAPPRHWLVVFFDIVGRKFWKLVQLNLIYCIFSIPAFAVLLFLSNMYANPLHESALDMYYARFILSLMFFCVPMVTVGPAAAGFTYVLRNFAREEHAWVWSDFFEHGLKNFRQAAIISLIDLAVSIAIVINANAYMQLEKMNSFMGYMKYVFFVVCIIYVMMHLYIWPLLVTFKLTIMQVFKNAFIFTMVKMFPNILITLLCVLLVYGSFFSSLGIGIILFPLITVSFIGLIINFYVYPIMKEYMMRDDEEGNQETEEEEEPVMTDELSSDGPEDAKQ